MRRNVPENGTLHYVDSYLLAQQNEKWESVWGRKVTEIKMSFPRENENEVT